MAHVFGPSFKLILLLANLSCNNFDLLPLKDPYINSMNETLWQIFLWQQPYKNPFLKIVYHDCYTQRWFHYNRFKSAFFEFDPLNFYFFFLNHSHFFELSELLFKIAYFYLLQLHFNGARMIRFKMVALHKKFEFFVKSIQGRYYKFMPTILLNKVCEINFPV